MHGGCMGVPEGPGGRRRVLALSQPAQSRRWGAAAAGGEGEGGAAGGEPGPAPLFRRRRGGAGGGLSPGRPGAAAPAEPMGLGAWLRSLGGCCGCCGGEAPAPEKEPLLR